MNKGPTRALRPLACIYVSTDNYIIVTKHNECLDLDGGTEQLAVPYVNGPTNAL
jgi:hypothetical protein